LSQTPDIHAVASRDAEITRGEPVVSPLSVPWHVAMADGVTLVRDTRSLSHARRPATRLELSLLNLATSPPTLNLGGALAGSPTSPSRTPTKRLTSPIFTHALLPRKSAAVMCRTPLPRLLPSLAALRSSWRIATCWRRNTKSTCSWAQACGRRQSLFG
jgi:hypothetical protein